MLHLNLLPFTDLHTERLLLRRITAQDAPALLRMRSSEKVMQYIGRPRAQNINDALELIAKLDQGLEQNAGITWGISMKENPELIGTIGFWRIDTDHHRGEIGYLLDDRYQRRGIMREALTAVLDHGFDNMQLHAVEGLTDPANEASIALLLQHGFVKEGYFRESYYFNGRFIDTAMFGLLGREWKERR